MRTLLAVLTVPVRLFRPTAPRPTPTADASMGPRLARLFMLAQEQRINGTLWLGVTA